MKAPFHRFDLRLVSLLCVCGALANTALAQAPDAGLHRVEVGQHPTQPALVADPALSEKVATLIAGKV